MHKKPVRITLDHQTYDRLMSLRQYDGLESSLLISRLINQEYRRILKRKAKQLEYENVIQAENTNGKTSR